MVDFEVLLRCGRRKGRFRTGRETRREEEGRREAFRRLTTEEKAVVGRTEVEGDWKMKKMRIPSGP